MRKPGNPLPAPMPRVLLIDDNRDGLLARKSVLEREGYSVTACDSPEAALETFANAEFELVITDFRMPQMTGIQLIQVMRAQRPAVPIVLISGMVDVLGLTEQNTGADAVVAKNASEVSHMVRAVNRLLHRCGAPKKPIRSQLGRRGTRAKTG